MAYFKIGFDATTLFGRPQRGVANSTANLYRHISALEPSWDFFLYCLPDTSTRENPWAGLENLKKREVDIRFFWRLASWGLWRMIWRHTSLPFAIWRDKIDLFHSLPANVPYYSPCAKVVMIFDLTPLKTDLIRPRHEVWNFRKDIAYSLRTAKKVIAVSEYTKKDILDTFGSKYEDKIEVIYLAPEDNCRPLQGSDRIKAVREKYSIKQPEPYILAFGDKYPRKNIRRLIESFAAFTKKIGKDVQLVIVGIASPEDITPFKKLAEELKIPDRVIFAGFVPEEDIPYLLSGAEFLMYVSLYEGFGLPPLDAMACDCPVIASNATSIPEAVGDAAILVDPYDTPQIADAMVNLFNDSVLRRDLIAKGRTRVKLFSWEKAAAETLNVYKKILGGPQ